MNGADLQPLVEMRTTVTRDSRPGPSLALRACVAIVQHGNPEVLRQLPLDELVERRLKLLAALWQISFLAMPQRRYAGRLLDDKQMVIDVDQPYVGFADCPRQRSFE